MKKLIMLLILLLFLPTSFAASYRLNFEWHQQSYQQQLKTTKEQLMTPQQRTQQLLPVGSFVGISVKDNKLYQVAANKATEQVGRLEKCAGLANTCIVMDKFFQLYLPKDLNFATKQHWRWGECAYDVNFMDNTVLFGRKLAQINITATCDNDNFDFVNYMFDKDLGITAINLYDQNNIYSYTLSSEKGFFAQDGQGHYQF